MIIIEGPDGGGKTTLALHLAKKYDIPIASKVVDSDTQPLVSDLKYWVEANLKKGLQWELFDRHRLISEPIYQSAMGRPAQPGFDDLAWFSARMLRFTQIRPFIVYCLPPYETVVENLNGDPNNTAVLKYIPQIYAGYIAHAAGDIARGQAVHFNYIQDPNFSRVGTLFDNWVRYNHFRPILGELGISWT